MKKEISLERVVDEDCEEIRNLMVKVFEDEKSKWFKNGGKPYIPGYNSIEMQKYHTWDHNYYKIIYDHNMIGVILVSYTGKEHARIDRLYILPEYQGISIGSTVLTLIEELYPEVNEWSLDTIQQSVRNHHFYEKNGYQLVGEDDCERYYLKVKNRGYETRDNYCCNKDLSKNNYRQCNMEAADLYDSNMSNSRFTNMNLQGNIYTNSNLVNNRFTNVNLSNSIFADSNLSKVEVCHVSLSKAHLHDINLDIENDECSVMVERCDLSNSRISNSDLENVCIENCNIEGMTINGIKVVDMLANYDSN